MELNTEKLGRPIQNDIILSMSEQIQSLVEALSLSETQKTILQQQLAIKDQQMKECTKKNESLMKALLQSEKQKKHMQKSGTKLQKIPETIPSCQKNHPLCNMTVNAAILMYDPECTLCGQQMGPSTMCWSCNRCGVLYCIRCKGYKKDVCTFGHELKFTKQYPHSYMVCDVCYTKGIKCGWHCQCDFDLCEVCYDKA